MLFATPNHTHTHTQQKQCPFKRPGLTLTYSHLGLGSGESGTPAMWLSNTSSSMPPWPLVIPLRRLERELRLVWVSLPETSSMTRPQPHGTGGHNPHPLLFQPHHLLHIPSLVTASNPTALNLTDSPLVPNFLSPTLPSFLTTLTSRSSDSHLYGWRGDRVCEQAHSRARVSPPPGLPPQHTLHCSLLWRDLFDKHMFIPKCLRTPNLRSQSSEHSPSTHDFQRILKESNLPIR